MYVRQYAVYGLGSPS